MDRVPLPTTAHPDHARGGGPPGLPPSPSAPSPAGGVDNPAGDWSPWAFFPRSSNIALARFKLRDDGAGGVWQVQFGGKPAPPTKKNPGGAGVTPIRSYEYGPDGLLTADLFAEWVGQYEAGGSAGIWFDLHVKRAAVACRSLGSQGA